MASLVEGCKNVLNIMMLDLEEMRNCNTGLCLH